MFDGRDNQALDLVYPAAYHPKAPCTAAAAGGALKIAYGYARRFGQVCWQSHVSINHQRPDLQVNYPDSFASTTWTAIGGGYHLLPAKATHLVGFAFVKLQEGIGSWTMHFRLHGIKGAGEDISSDVPIQTNAADPSQALRNVAPFGDAPVSVLGPFADNVQGNVVVRMDLTLDKLFSTSAAAIVYSKIEAYGGWTAPGPITLTPAIVPHASMVFWECRG